VWQTRVRDSDPFVQAKGYDAIGAESSVIMQMHELNDTNCKIQLDGWVIEANVSTFCLGAIL
jgi:hypothetical protein